MGITGDVSCSVKQEVNYSVHDVKKEEMIDSNDIDDTPPKVSTDTDDTLPPPTQTSLHEEIYQHYVDAGLCPVCGDKPSGLHYGLITCEACKTFFKRTIQGNLSYVCRNLDNACLIDKLSRNRCKSCRYNRCLSEGMVRDYVSSQRLRGGRRNT